MTAPRPDLLLRSFPIPVPFPNDPDPGDLPGAGNPGPVQGDDNQILDSINTVQNNINLSSVSQAQMSLAIIFAVWTFIPVLTILLFHLRKRLRQPMNGQHWYTYIYLPGMSTRVTPAVKVKTADLASPLLAAAGIVLFAFYITEAIIGGTGGDISSWGDVAFVSALRYFGFTFPDLCIVALLLMVVKDRPGLLHPSRNFRGPYGAQAWKDLSDLFLLFLSAGIVIAVFVCICAISLLDETGVGVVSATGLRHTQTVLYLLLVIDVIVSALKFQKVLLKYGCYDQPMPFLVSPFSSASEASSISYTTSSYIHHKQNLLTIPSYVNFGITGVITMLLFGCILAAYPRCSYATGIETAETPTAIFTEFTQSHEDPAECSPPPYKENL